MTPPRVVSLHSIPSSAMPEGWEDMELGFLEARMKAMGVYFKLTLKGGRGGCLICDVRSTLNRAESGVGWA